MSKRMSTTDLAVMRLRAAGWTTAKSERWIPAARVLRDLWGLVDAQAIRRSFRGTLYVHACAASDLPRKFRHLSEPDREAKLALIAATNRMELWAFEPAGHLLRILVRMRHGAPDRVTYRCVHCLPVARALARPKGHHWTEMDAIRPPENPCAAVEGRRGNEKGLGGNDEGTVFS